MVSLHEILEKLQKGEISPQEAEGHIRRKPFEEMGYAKLDTQRRFRSGFPEVVFAQGKADEHLVSICQRLFQLEGELLVTRATPEQYTLIAEILPEAKYDAKARIITCGKEKRKPQGCIAVCTAGTADIPVAEEAAQVAEYFGCHVERIYDVGVSGLHRLLSQLPSFKRPTVSLLWQAWKELWAVWWQAWWISLLLRCQHLLAMAPIWGEYLPC